MNSSEESENTLSRVEKLKQDILNDINNSRFVIMTALSEENNDTLRKALLELYRDYQNIEMKIIALKEESNDKRRF